MLKSVAITHSHTRLSFLYLELLCLLVPFLLRGRRFHDFNQFLVDHQKLGISIFSISFSRYVHDQQKAKEFEETHLDVNTSLEIFSKRIYHSTNSVTHTESNQQHTIFLYCWSTNAICCVTIVLKRF